MIRSNLAVACGLVLGGQVFLLGQQNGRFASLKSQAFTAFERGQYSQVAGKLEEIWEQDQTDAKVAEYLAIGYLYGEHSIDKARPLMKKAIDLGGQATFLFQHSHENRKLKIINGDTMNNFCTGKMSITPGKLTFTADDGKDSMAFKAGELQELKLLNGSPGRIEIKAEGKPYTFRVKTERNDEAALFNEIAGLNLKPAK